MDKQQREYIHHLMLQYSDAMVRLTYRRVGDWHLAEDLVQETFLTANGYALTRNRWRGSLRH